MARCFQCMREFDGRYELCPFCGSERNQKPKELYFLTPGTLIAGRYEIGVSVGSGGFGITYKAWDHTLSKVVAIKEYYPAGLVNRVPGEKNVIVYSGNRGKECGNGKVRFLEEARNMARFNTHPNIINVYDFFEENNTAYIIMEFLEGVNYKEYIKQQGGRVTISRALEVTQAVLAALSEVHRHGILHRDISPDNIFIGEDGHIKVIDFGAARFSEKEEAKTRSVILKPGFAPPEQYQTKSRQGPWTDIYAAGATLYRAVTGNVPEESVNRVEEDLLVPPEKFCPDMSHNLNNAILRSMALQPELRFQDAEEFGEALSGEMTIRDVGKELRMRKVRRFASISLIGAVVLAGMAVCLKIIDQRKAEAAILEPAKVSVWISARSEEEAPEELEIFEAALEEFRSEYPQIEVDVQCWAEETYQVRLREAMDDGALPALFESSCLWQDDYEYLADLSDVLHYINAKDYYFLERYTDYFPNKKQLPLSFSMPVVFYNTLANPEQKPVERLLEEGDFLVSEGGFFTWYNLYGGGEPVLDFRNWTDAQNEGDRISDPDLFLRNDAACLITDTTAYNWIQSNMPGIYEIGFWAESGMTGSFRDYFSISADASGEEKAAAVQILVYLLADTAQDVRYVQNGIYLPLNKKIYKAFTAINGEFADLEKGFRRASMAGEYQGAIDAWYKSLKSGK